MDDNYADAAQRIVALLGDDGARLFLKLLEQDNAFRADAFRHLHERGRLHALLDAITDLEADPVMHGWLIAHLRLAFGGRMTLAIGSNSTGAVDRRDGLPDPSAGMDWPEWIAAIGGLAGVVSATYVAVKRKAIERYLAQDRRASPI
jgi:hypothetical protein